MPTFLNIFEIFCNHSKKRNKVLPQRNTNIRWRGKCSEDPETALLQSSLGLHCLMKRYEAFAIVQHKNINVMSTFDQIKTVKPFFSESIQLHVQSHFA